MATNRAEYQREWCRKHRDSCGRSSKKWNDAHPEYMAAYCREWRKKKKLGIPTKRKKKPGELEYTGRIIIRRCDGKDYHFREIGRPRKLVDIHSGHIQNAHGDHLVRLLNGVLSGQLWYAGADNP